MSMAPTKNTPIQFVARAVFACSLILLAGFSAFAKNTDEVIAAEKARGELLVAGDAKALDKVTCDNFRYVHSTGKVQDKAIFVGGIASGEIKYRRFELSNLVADEITPDVVALSGTIDQDKFSSGKWGEIRLLFLEVWKKESGTWKLCNIQTVFPPPPAS